jgi:ankyrin repeat protein
LCACASLCHAQGSGRRAGRLLPKPTDELFCPKVAEGGADDSSAPRDEHSKADDGVEVMPNSCTPLMRAANVGDAAAVKALLSEGVDVNEKSPQGFTALMLAADEGHVEIVKLLIKAHADVNAEIVTLHIGQFTTLNYAVSSGNMEVIDALVEAGAELNPKNFVGMPPFFLALQFSKDITFIKALLARGADVNLRAANGGTALMVAASASSPAIVQLLIEAGADVNAKTDEGGMTALSMAAEAGRDDIVQLLKRAGAVE